MTVSASQAKWHAGGGPLERPVRQHALDENSMAPRRTAACSARTSVNRTAPWAAAQCATFCWRTRNDMAEHWQARRTARTKRTSVGRRLDSERYSKP